MSIFKTVKDENAEKELNLDHDEKQEKKEELSMCVETDDYDIMPELDKDEEEFDDLDEKQGIEIEYTFKGDDVRQGLKAYQKETLYKKNIIFTLILAVICGIYVYQFATNTNLKVSAFLAALCIAVIAMIWYNPLKHIKLSAKAADENDLSFKMTVYDDCVRIKEENGKVVLHFVTEITKIIETVDLYLLCVGKERVFILPKKCIPEESKNSVKEIFKKALGEKYLEKLK